MTSKEEMTAGLEASAASGRVYMVYLDLNIITDSELLQWTITECKRCFGKDVEIIAHNGDRAKADGLAAVRALESMRRDE